MSEALLTTFDLTKISDNIFRISWIADNDDRNYIYRNGVLLGYLDSGTNRYIEFTADETELSVIEVHDIPIDYDGIVNSYTAFPSITERVRDLFTLNWNRVEDAVAYKIYYKEADGSEIDLIKILQDDVTQKYTFTLPRLKSIGGVWHHFRVESLDNWNNESNVLYWHYFVYGLPEFPSSVEVTGGSGVFNIKITI